jgi:hypothetical protein
MQQQLLEIHKQIKVSPESVIQSTNSSHPLKALTQRQNILTTFRSLLRVGMSCFSLWTRWRYMFTCSTLLNLQKVLLCMTPYLPRTSITFYMQTFWCWTCGSLITVTEFKYTHTNTQKRKKTVKNTWSWPMLRRPKSLESYLSLGTWEWCIKALCKISNFRYH